MSNLHILNPRSGAHVFRGMVGTLVDSPVEGKIRFKLDAGLLRASNLLSGTSLAEGLDVDADEVVTIEAEEPLLRGLKATLLRALCAQWRQGYERLGLQPQQDGQTGQVPAPAALAAFLGAVGAGNTSVMQQALQAEQNMASQAIDSLVESIPGIAPYWVDVRLKHAWVGTNMEATKRVCGYPHAIEAAALPNPVAMDPAQSLASQPHPNYTAQAQLSRETPPQAGQIDVAAEGVEAQPGAVSAPPLSNQEPLQTAAQPEDGWFDLDAAIPVYLPDAAPTPPARATPRLFGSLISSFGSAPAAPAEPAGNPQDANARALLNILLSTPVLKSMLIESAAAIEPNYASRVLSQTVQEPDLDEDDEDGDGFGRPRA